MTTYYIYLMPYLRAGVVCYYTGYTNNPARREHEHNTDPKDRHYHFCGRMHVVAMEKEDGQWWVWSDGYAEPIETQKLAMEAERVLKKATSYRKERFYVYAHEPEWKGHEVEGSP